MLIPQDVKETMGIAYTKLAKKVCSKIDKLLADDDELTVLISEQIDRATAGSVKKYLGYDDSFGRIEFRNDSILGKRVRDAVSNAIDNNMSSEYGEKIESMIAEEVTRVMGGKKFWAAIKRAIKEDVSNIAMDRGYGNRDKSILERFVDGLDLNGSD